MIKYSSIFQTGADSATVPNLLIGARGTLLLLKSCNADRRRISRSAGVQSLLAVACGWCCGKWQVLEADPTVQYTNTLVLKFCIPCLQVWLLAIKTDMRQPGNWRYATCLHQQQMLKVLISQL